jgi:hypothetical protein
MRPASRPAFRLSATSVLLLSFAACLCAQQSAEPQNTSQQNGSAQNAAGKDAPLPVTEETHHELLLKNAYMNVYGVNIPAQDATLPFRHDQPYLAISIGPSVIEIAADGQPPVRLIQRNGNTSFVPNPGTLVIRSSATVPYRGVAIELLKPQGDVKGGEMVDFVAAGDWGTRGVDSSGASSSAPKSPKTKPSARKRAAQAAASAESSSATDDDAAGFETDEIRVEQIRLSGSSDYTDAKPAQAALMVALANSTISVTAGDNLSLLHDGDVLWLPAGAARKATSFLADKSGFLLISFKDAGVAK